MAIVPVVWVTAFEGVEHFQRDRRCRHWIVLPSRSGVAVDTLDVRDRVCDVLHCESICVSDESDTSTPSGRCAVVEEMTVMVVRHELQLVAAALECHPDIEVYESLTELTAVTEAFVAKLPLPPRKQTRLAGIVEQTAATKTTLSHTCQLLGSQASEYELQQFLAAEGQIQRPVPNGVTVIFSVPALLLTPLLDTLDFDVNADVSIKASNGTTHLRRSKRAKRAKA